MYLSVSLRGQAQGVFSNLSSKTTDYNELVKALEERFAPPNQTELYRVQLRDRRQRAHETMAELGQDIRRLTNLAYPSVPGDVRETLAKEQFVDALLHAEMRLKIKQSRPADLNDAVRHAVELEAFYRAEQRHGASSITKTDNGDKSELESLKKMLEQLQCTVNEKSKQKDQQSNSHFGRNSKQLYDTARSQWRRSDQYGTLRRQDRTAKPKASVNCYECGSDKHIRRNCPRLRKQNSDDKNVRYKPEDRHSAKCAGKQMSGLYITAQIEGFSVSCLIDTGATLSLMSSTLWERIRQNLTLKEYQSSIVSASGNQMDVLGKTRVMLTFNSVQCEMDFVVVKTDCDIIIGLDFMKQFHVSVDVDTETCMISGKQIKLQCTGKIGCYRVTVSEKQVLPV